MAELVGADPFAWLSQLAAAAAPVTQENTNYETILKQRRTKDVQKLMCTPQIEN